MFKMRSNKIYICNIDSEAAKYQKQFELTMSSHNSNMHLSERGTDTRYDENAYKRGVLLKQQELVQQKGTTADKQSQLVHTQTHLRNTMYRNDHEQFNSYKPSGKSDMYTLSTPIQPYDGHHGLLFEKPNFSSSCVPPVASIDPFHNFTREQRNK